MVGEGAGVGFCGEAILARTHGTALLYCTLHKTRARAHTHTHTHTHTYTHTHTHTQVRQTDFVPTISVILGIAIPFGNLGAVIPDLLASTGSRIKDAANVLASTHANTAQVLMCVDVCVRARRGVNADDYGQIIVITSR